MGVASGLAAVGRARRPEEGRKGTEGAVPCLRETLRGACDPLQRRARAPRGLWACLPTVHPLLPPLTRPHTHALVRLTCSHLECPPSSALGCPFSLFRSQLKYLPREAFQKHLISRSPHPHPHPRADLIHSSFHHLVSCISLISTQSYII